MKNQQDDRGNGSSPHAGASLSSPEPRMNRHNQSDADDEDDRGERQGLKADCSEPNEGAASRQRRQKQSITKDAQKKAPINMTERQEGQDDQI